MREVFPGGDVTDAVTPPQRENPVSFVAGLLKRLGDEEGIEVVLEETWGYVGWQVPQNGTLTIVLPKKNPDTPKMKKIPVEEA